MELNAEIKGALDAHGAALEKAIEKFDGQLKDTGTVATEAKAEVKALSEKFESTVTELVQKMDKASDKTNVLLTAGAEFVASDKFKSLVSGQTEKARVEVKNTVLSGSTTVFPDQRPGVIPGNFLPTTIRQLLPSVPVTGNMVNSLRELSWTNSAAEVSQGTAKPESDITFEPYNVPITTVAHFIKVSKQLLADAPAIAAYINVRLFDGLAQKVDAQLLIGNGTSPALSGLTDSGNYTAFTALSSANLVESINRAKYVMWATGNVPDSVIVNPADWGEMELAREGAGTGAYLYGAPGTNAGMNPFGLQVALSNHMPAGNFLIGSLRSSAMVYNREGAVIEAGFVNADFTLNLVTLRAEERLGLGCERPAGIYYGDFSL
jgi:HK97 family phage major capsid protein